MAHNRLVLIRRLREATAADHDAVEGVMPLMHADLSAQQYTDMLSRIYGVVAPWEALAEQVAPASLLPLVRERARERLLARDLIALGVDPKSLPLGTLPAIEGEAELLGAMYVMEGSRLGGQLIARHVDEVLGDLGRDSTRYFRGFGEETGPMWKRFTALLELELPERDTVRAVRAARAMFHHVEDWMRVTTPQGAGRPRAGTGTK